MKPGLIFISLIGGLWAGGAVHESKLIVQDHGHAGTPTVPVDLDAIEATQQAAIEALRPDRKLTHDPAPDKSAGREHRGDVESGGDPAAMDDLLSTSYRSELPRLREGVLHRSLPAAKDRSFLPPGTQLFFFAADVASDREHLATLEPHVEAYCIAYASLKDVIALRATTGATCLIQPLSSDELPRHLGLRAYPALVTVAVDGSLTIQEGLR